MKAPAKPSPADIIVTPEGITVYPPLNEDGCWRAVWYEPDGRRRFSSARDEAGLATKLEPVRRRLVADAEHTEDLGSDLVAHYLSPDRHPIDRRWSPSHLSKQRRYCENYILPVIGKVRCDKIRVSQMQAAVNAPNTADAGRRVAKTVAAMVKLGIKDGYLTNPRLGMVHWQPGDREIPAPNVRVAGQNADFVEIAEIPGHDDVDALGTAVLDSRRAPWWRQLMPYVSAYSGLRIGELLSLGAEDVHADDRALAVTWQVIEVDGKLLRVPPKGGKRRTTVYPVSTPSGFQVAVAMARRAKEAAAEQAQGRNPLGLMFPAARGGHFWPANFDRRVAIPAYVRSEWRDEDGNGSWTWHSLRHLFCTTALNDWKLDITDVAALAGHSSARITMEMYLGNVAGTLARAFEKTGRSED